MNRTLLVVLITLIVLSGGVFLYYSSQKEKNEPQQTGGHGVTTSGGHQPVTQGQRSYEPEITSDTTNIKPNQPAKFSYKIKNDRGEILKNYETVHEKIMHFITVRKDLAYFRHLHPEFNEATGEFTVDVIFPEDGPYRVFPDFTPGVENPQKLPVTVYHDIGVGNASKYYAQSIVPDSDTRKRYGDYGIVTTFPRDAKKQTEHTYSLDISKSGKPVTNLENYLGALGHSVILKAETLDFIHTHALEAGDGSKNQGHGQQQAEHESKQDAAGARGPIISFSTTFPESGVYKIFTQFQHEGEVQTVDYIVKVE